VTRTLFFAKSIVQFSPLHF